MNPDQILDLEEPVLDRFDRFRLPKLACWFALICGAAVWGLATSFLHGSIWFSASFLLFLVSFKEGRWIVIPIGVILAMDQNILSPSIEVIFSGIGLLGLGFLWWWGLIRLHPRPYKWWWALGMILIITDRFMFRHLFYDIPLMIGAGMIVVGAVLRLKGKTRKNVEDGHKLIIWLVFALGSVVNEFFYFGFMYYLAAFSLVFFSWVIAILLGIYPLEHRASKADNDFD